MLKKFSYVLFCIIFFFNSACSTMKPADEKEAKNKKVAEIYVQLGMAYLAKGDVQRSKQKLLYAQKKAPYLPEVWYSTGYFYEKTGNQTLAKENYLKAVQLAPNRGDVLNNYGTFLCRRGQYQEAISYFMQATQDTQYLDNAGAYENAGLCALKIPDKAQAIKYFNLALETDPARMTSLSELNKIK
jgi:type IV pilus assembly protein PilF